MRQRHPLLLTTIYIITIMLTTPLCRYSARAFAAIPSRSSSTFGLLKQPQATTRRFLSSESSNNLLLPSPCFVLHYNYVPDILEKRPPHREEHLALATAMTTATQMLAAGPYTVNDKPTGAYFLFTSKQAAQEFYDKDPYVPAGLVTDYQIQEWNVVVQQEK